VITLAEYQVAQEGETWEEMEVYLMEDQEEEVVIEPDERDLLVIRRALNV